MTVSIPTPNISSPLSAIQGNVAYGDGNPNTVTTITYNFDQYAGSQAWTSAYKDDFRAALAIFESVANIQFVEVNDWRDADIYEVISPSSNPNFFDSPNILGYHVTPFNGPSEGAFNTDFWTAGPGGNGDPGGFFFTTLLHELGHALGLGHPHDGGLGTTVMSGVTSPFNSFGTGNLNQGIFTVMSYNDGWTQVNGILPANSAWGGSTGLGALDIAALQAMYGANTSYNSGTNSYNLASFNSSGVGYQAIWDTGGIDTIRHTGSAAATIDLRPATLGYDNLGGGAVSYVQGVDGGFTIAAGVVIENASGGSGNDIIIGNTAQNVLNGNGGNDTIYSVSDGTNNNTIRGGFGQDIIHLANGSGADTVYGNEDNDVAIVVNNTGSFEGGEGWDTVRFASAVNTYLFLNNGSSYTIFNVVTRASFTVMNDVEGFEFSWGTQQYTLPQISAATQIFDIETTGTTLQHAAHGIYLVGGSSSNIAVTNNGAIVGAFSIVGWSAIQTQANEFGGFGLLWQNTGGAYHEWALNDQGQRVSGRDITNVVDVEVFYGTDLNNDGTVGHKVTLIEDDGSTTLSSSTQGMYLINGSTEILQNGAPVGPNSIPGWSAIQAEAANGGYNVLWQNVNGDYYEWILNGQGALIGGSVVGNVIDVEVFYGADINNDGTTGHFTTLIEDDGSTTLSSSTQGMYLINGSTEILQNGAPVGPNSIPGWSAIQAEAANGGYNVLWQNVNGDYYEWILNGQGALIGGSVVGNVIDVEVFYGADINNDGTTGHFTTLIEDDGSTTLSSSTQGMYLINGSTEILQNGAPVGPNSIPGWSAIQAEAANGGYNVLWQNVNGDYYEWILNGQGALIGGSVVGNVIDVEVFYGADINNDGTTGHFTTLIEDDGSTTLSSSTQGMYLINGSTEIFLNGAVVGPDTIAGWSAIHAEATGNGYRVLWENDSREFYEWTLNSQGELVGGGGIPDVADVEVFYGADIDGSGTTGTGLPRLNSSVSERVINPLLEGAAEDEFQFSFSAADAETVEGSAADGDHFLKLTGNVILSAENLWDAMPDLGDQIERSPIELFLHEDDVFLF